MVAHLDLLVITQQRNSVAAKVWLSGHLCARAIVKNVISACEFSASQPPFCSCDVGVALSLLVGCQRSVVPILPGCSWTHSPMVEEHCPDNTEPNFIGYTDDSRNDTAAKCNAHVWPNFRRRPAVKPAVKDHRMYEIPPYAQTCRAAWTTGTSDDRPKTRHQGRALGACSRRWRTNGEGLGASFYDTRVGLLQFLASNSNSNKTEAGIHYKTALCKTLKSRHTQDAPWTMCTYPQN